MRTALLSLTLAVGLMLLPQTAMAQPTAAGTAANELVAPVNLTLGGVAGLPQNASNTGPLTPSLEFLVDASTKDRVGTVAVGWKDGQGVFRLLFSGPLDSSGETEPISLLGLPTGATAKLEFNRLNWRGPTPLEQMQALDLCTKTLKEINAQKGTPDAPIKLEDCDARSEALQKFPLVQSVLRQLYHLDDRIWLWGLDASVERTTFNYLTSDTLDPGKETDETVSGTARLGYFAGPYGFLFGSYTYKHAYRPGSSATQVCRPIGSTGSTRCDQAVLGKPRPTTLSIATLELRKFFASRAAINPSVQYDFRNHISAVDVPIYYIKSSDGTPTGGVRFAWRSDTKQVTASLFVGGALGLLP